MANGHGLTLIVRAFNYCKTRPPSTKPGMLSSPATSASKSANSQSGDAPTALGVSFLSQPRHSSEPRDTPI